MKSILLVVIMMGVCVAKAQHNPFQRVKVPDSIQLRLEEAYKKNADKVNAGSNVFNLSNRKDFVFHSGIYSFQGQGPHFYRRIFIFNKSMLFVFQNEGAFNPGGVLHEFVNCIDSLHLTNKQIVNYSKVISDYLRDEEGLTYGTEIK